jgi:hypothetical protein
MKLIRRYSIRLAIFYYQPNLSTVENNRQLAILGVPVARFVSTNRQGIPLGEDKSQIGLNHVLNLGIGCIVMLRTNFWVQGGIVNGTVRAIVWLSFSFSLCVLCVTPKAASNFK